MFIVVWVFLNENQLKLYNEEGADKDIKALYKY